MSDRTVAERARSGDGAERVPARWPRLAIVVAAALAVIAVAAAISDAASRPPEAAPATLIGSTRLAVVATGDSHCWSIQRVDIVEGSVAPLVDCAEWASLDAKGRWASWRHLDAARTSTVLETVDLRSSEAREVVRAKGRGIIPGPFSPGGRYLSWDWCTTVTFPAECGGTAVADLSATPPPVLELPIGISWLSWSPDDSLAVVEGNDGGLSIARGDGSDRRALGQGSFLAWSPDGRRFAVVVDGGLEIRLRDGTPQTRMPIDADGFVAASWSPDGRTLAIRHDPHRFGSGDEGVAAEIRLIDLGGLREQAVVLGPGCVDRTALDPTASPRMDCRGVVEPAGGYPMVWSPDGRSLAFSLAPAGVGDPLVGTAVVDVEGGKVTILDDAGRPAWSTDGQRLLVATAAGVDVVDADGSNRRQVLASPGRIDSKWGVWIPDAPS